MVVLERRDTRCKVARRNQVRMGFMERLSKLALGRRYESSDGRQGRPAAAE